MAFLPLVLFVACAPPPAESPATLTNMTQVLLEDFGTDAAPAEVEALVAWLRDNVDAEDGYELGEIGEEDIEGLPHSDGLDWEKVRGAGVLSRMRGTLDMYATVVPEADQSFADPRTYNEWSRTITSGDAESFLAGADLGTDNHIDKGGPFGISIQYDPTKDYRWYGDVLAFRTNVPEEGWSNDHNNGIVAGFTIELWFDDDEGMIWYNGSWTELITAVDGVADPDFMMQELIDGTLDYFYGTEAHVNGEDQE